MKKLMLLILLLITVKVYSQVVVIDTATFISGGGITADSVRWWDLGGQYSFIWIAVKDTGSTYTDSLIVQNIVKFGTYNTDSSISPQQLQYAGTFYGSTSVSNSETTYWVYNNAIMHLQIYLANKQFITGRRVKIKILGVLRSQTGNSE